MAQIIQIDTSQRDALKEVRQGIARLAVLDRYLKVAGPGSGVSGNCTFTYDDEEGKKRHMSFPCTSDVFEHVLLNEACSISALIAEKSQRHQIGLEEPEAALCRKYESQTKKRAAR